MTPMAALRAVLKLAVAVGFTLAGAAFALAQTDAATGYPRQTIRIVIGLSPGATPDLVARLVAAKLGERLGQPAIVENKAGAGGIIAAEAVARATPAVRPAPTRLTVMSSMGWATVAISGSARRRRTPTDLTSETAGR